MMRKLSLTSLALAATLTGVAQPARAQVALVGFAPLTQLVCTIPPASPEAVARPQSSYKPGWELVFQDEFTNDAQITNGAWNTGYPWGQVLGQELEYYTRYDKNFPTACDKGGLNHIFGGGTLKLRAKVEPGDYEVWHWDSLGQFYTTCEPYKYTSGMLWSSQTFKYGYFEIRCKVPNDGKVLWPAFWLYDGSGGYREIDGFEFGGTTPNRPGFNMHIASSLEGGYVHSDHTPDGLNHYPSSYAIPSADVSSAFHTYGIKWAPSSVTWYVDDQPVYSTPGHSPPLPMHLIINLAVAPWGPFPADGDFPADFTIDYVRVYRALSDEVLWEADNGGTGKIDWWSMSPQDQYVVGDFAQAGRDALMAFSTTGYSHLMQYNAPTWSTAWINQGSGQIAWWSMSPSDRYLAGDFDGDGRDDLLAVAQNGWCHLMRYYAGDWHYQWGNGGSGSIKTWALNPNDWYVAGDFDHDGRDDLMAINPNGWAQMLRFDGSDWQYVWGNGGSGSIDWWNIHAGDVFTAGDFNGDGRTELLAVAPGTGWANLMQSSGPAGWGTSWTNFGSGKVATWYIHPGDRFMAAAFQGGPKDELIAISQTGWAHIMKRSATDWDYVYGNDGGSKLHAWWMNPSDKYLAGSFAADGRDRLMALSALGWWHVMKLARP